MLRGCGEGSKAENIDEILSVGTSAIDGSYCAVEYVERSFARVVRYVEHRGKVVCRTGRDDAYREVNAVVEHLVYHETYGAVATGYDYAVGVAEIFERVAVEVDIASRDGHAGILENIQYRIEESFRLLSSGFVVV